MNRGGGGETSVEIKYFSSPDRLADLMSNISSLIVNKLVVLGVHMWSHCFENVFQMVLLSKKNVAGVAFIWCWNLDASAVDQKHLESFEMWCWRRVEKISWTNHVRNEELLLRVKEQRNILHEIRKRKANWIGHILRRNCLLQRVIEGKIEGW